MESFEYTAHPARVVFGSGTLGRLRAEVERAGGRRVLLLTGPRPGAAGAAGEVLGPLLVAHFRGAAMHTPVEVTDRALELVRHHDADFLVSVGGGSSTGLGKALAARTGLPLIAVPTTYAGSEMTPVVGETAGGVKTTRSSPDLLAKAVIYDVDLTLGLPVGLSVTSGVNALAHAVEALYSPQANPAVDDRAESAIRRLASALPRIVERPGDADARADALAGAWLAGMCLGAVGMGLHHKLCHVLGGAFDLPHAETQTVVPPHAETQTVVLPHSETQTVVLPHSETHTVLLPHVMAYNAAAAPEAMRRVAAALGVADAPGGMYDLIARLGGPTSLAALGLPESALAEAAARATAQPYPNPRDLTTEGVLGVLTDAWRGERPAGGAPNGLPDIGWLTDQVVASFGKAANPRVAVLLGDLARRLHGFVRDNDVTEDEWRHAIDFLTRTGQLCGPTRQEFILLSDTLGVSSAVDVLSNSRTPESTPSAVLGPFYVEGPPSVPHGTDLSQGLPGIPLWADIRVTDLDGNPVPDAVVDVWQSNQDGFYDVQLPDLDGPVLRGRLRAGGDGRLTFWSILPSQYPIPDDGPVGQLLRATGRHPYRAPHLHFMIMAPGFRRLVTQLFVAGGPYLDSDAVFGVKEELIVDFAARTGRTPDGRAVDGQWRSVSFTFRIAPA